MMKTDKEESVLTLLTSPNPLVRKFSKSLLKFQNLIKLYDIDVPYFDFLDCYLKYAESFYVLEFYQDGGYKLYRVSPFEEVYSTFSSEKLIKFLLKNMELTTEEIELICKHREEKAWKPISLTEYPTEQKVEAFDKLYAIALKFWEEAKAKQDYPSEFDSAAYEIIKLLCLNNPEIAEQEFSKLVENKGE